MRRSDRQLSERQQLDAIIRRCRICRLGLVDEGQPYVVPLCFGYDGRSVFLHMASEGRKIACLRRNNRVCIEFDIPGDIIDGAGACNWSMAYESVIAFGAADFLQSDEEKREGLSHIMNQYSADKTDWFFPAINLQKTVVVRVHLTEITGKERK